MQKQTGSLYVFEDTVLHHYSITWHKPGAHAQNTSLDKEVLSAVFFSPRINSQPLPVSPSFPPPHDSISYTIPPLLCLPRTCKLMPCPSHFFI